MSVFTHLVAELGQLLEPVLDQSATAAAIVLFTVLVRLALHPLSRAAFRGATPAAGCLPLLLQLPVFFVMYQAFSSAKVGGEANELLGHRLFAAPLGSRWTEALGEGGPFGAQGLVFLGLFGAIAVVAAWSAVRGRKAAAVAAAAAAAASAATPAGRGKATPGAAKGRPGAQPSVKAAAKAAAKAGAKPGAKAGVVAEVSAEQQEVMRKLGGVLPLLSFGTLITAAVVPLAAGLYLLTTTAWSVAERIWLQYRKERAECAEKAAEQTEQVEQMA
ncbi:YidC/Oxa1 family membrane protein insertase [Streptomyces sp. MB09-01]|uniref:YidC/Oxa1 family membrane protein insertase n=1 Tax=Streptomyces sp. MB09-01 TaxID=3028666 RepID=UPI0029B9DCFD|nr:YidC/Oxa1 family membrane protein insertase [Streptomyces sp. MB09-01]MDX3540434.1 YidC/Oxa1 family membrane protein insertase [Streptomyces sp. MB09-01]